MLFLDDQHSSAMIPTLRGCGNLLTMLGDSLIQPFQSNLRTFGKIGNVHSLEEVIAIHISHNRSVPKYIKNSSAVPTEPSNGWIAATLRSHVKPKATQKKTKMSLYLQLDEFFR